MTTTHNHPRPAHRTATVKRGITARLRPVAERLSDRLFAAADDHARALGWEVTRTGRLGLTGRVYRDPRFDARRRPPGHAGQDG